MTFKQGDIIRCTDPGYCFITKGREYIALEDSAGESGYVHDNDGDRSTYSVSEFELVRAAGAPKSKLRLPFLFTAHGTNDYVMSVGSEGRVTLVSAQDGTLYKDHCDEDTAIGHLRLGVWVMKGGAVDPSKVKAVDDAKKALAAAEEALASHQPYLA